MDDRSNRYQEYIKERRDQFNNIPQKKNSYFKFYLLGVVIGIMVVGPLGAYIFLTQKINSNYVQPKISNATTEVVVAKPTVKLLSESSLPPIYVSKTPLATPIQAPVVTSTPAPTCYILDKPIVKISCSACLSNKP